MENLSTVPFTTFASEQPFFAEENLQRSATSSFWCAVTVRPRWEKLVAESLRAKEYEEFVPLYRKRSRWSDRVKEIELPLFAGYVFCRADWCGRPPVVSTPGVTGILRFGDSIARISEAEIANLKTIAGAGAPAVPWPYLTTGQRVRISSGAMRGLEGILTDIKGDYRIILSVDALCRSVAVEIDRDCVVPVSSPRPKGQ
ncbi:MAG TPA: UpxY family transcription antiterminator [Bryobacteraceae bacterium]|jgi:transcription antitermination factor NusG